jgi:hypothetical protein
MVRHNYQLSENFATRRDQNRDCYSPMIKLSFNYEKNIVKKVKISSNPEIYLKF